MAHFCVRDDNIGTASVVGDVSKAVGRRKSEWGTGGGGECHARGEGEQSGPYCSITLRLFYILCKEQVKLTRSLHQRRVSIIRRSQPHVRSCIDLVRTAKESSEAAFEVTRVITKQASLARNSESCGSKTQAERRLEHP